MFQLDSYSLFPFDLHLNSQVKSLYWGYRCTVTGYVDTPPAAGVWFVQLQQDAAQLLATRALAMLTFSQRSKADKTREREKKKRENKVIDELMN